MLADTLVKKWKIDFIRGKLDSLHHALADGNECIKIRKMFITLTGVMRRRLLPSGFYVH